MKTRDKTQDLYSRLGTEPRRQKWLWGGREEGEEQTLILCHVTLNLLITISQVGTYGN